jgi:hypothetical protein
LIYSSRSSRRRLPARTMMNTRAGCRAMETCSASPHGSTLSRGAFSAYAWRPSTKDERHAS